MNIVGELWFETKAIFGFWRMKIRKNIFLFTPLIGTNLSQSLQENGLLLLFIKNIGENLFFFNRWSLKIKNIIQNKSRKTEIGGGINQGWRMRNFIQFKICWRGWAYLTPGTCVVLLVWIIETEIVWVGIPLFHQECLLPCLTPVIRQSIDEFLYRWFFGSDFIFFNDYLRMLLGNLTRNGAIPLHVTLCLLCWVLKKYFLFYFILVY